MKTLTILILLITNCIYANNKLTYTEKVIALTILGEARGEGKSGMYAVACVLKQRAVERKLGLAKVCLQRKQFSCWNGGRDLNHLLKGKSAPYAVKLARHLAAGGDLKRQYVNQANHYCTLKTNPYWAKGIKPVKIIKNHKFYKL